MKTKEVEVYEIYDDWDKERLSLIIGTLKEVHARMVEWTEENILTNSENQPNYAKDVYEAYPYLKLFLDKPEEWLKLGHEDIWNSWKFRHIVTITVEL